MKGPSMFRMLLRSALLAIVALTLATPAFAQASLTQTRLATRISSASQTVITVSSATGFVAGQIVYVDREAMLTRSVSGTSITVSRGYAGTAATEHVNGAIVWTGVAHYFYFNDPNPGACWANQQLVQPYINVLTGNIWYCRNDFGAALGGKWHGVNDGPIFASVPRTQVRSTTNFQVHSYTALLSDVYLASHTWTGELEIFLPAATGLLGKVYIIKDEALTCSTGGTAGRTCTIRALFDDATNNTTIASGGILRVIGGVSSRSAYSWFIWD